MKIYNSKTNHYDVSKLIFYSEIYVDNVLFEKQFNIKSIYHYRHLDVADLLQEAI